MSFGKILYKGLLSILFILIAVFIAVILKFNQSGVSFEFFEYRIYTTSSFILILFSLLFYLCLRGIYLSLRLKYVFEMRSLKYQYKQTMYKTKQQNMSLEISKSLRNLGGKNFVKTFLLDLRLENLPYYKFYTKNMSSFRKLITAKKVYKNNENNSTATIIYAKALKDSAKFTQAKQLLCDFIDNKSLQIQNARSMYIMCQIIVGCEKKISNNLNFVKKYIDYIEDYDKTNN